MTPEQFKQARQSLGLTQEQMAQALGYGNKQRVSDLETGKRGITGAIERLTRAYIDGYRPKDWPA